MGKRFPYVPVANVTTPVIGGTPSRSIPNYWGGSIKWAAAKDIVNVKGRYLYSTEEFITQEGIDKSAAKILPRGTVVITARGTVGALAQLGKDMAFNQTCYGLIAKESILSDFLYYALKGSFSKMRSLSYGTIFDTITIKTFDHLTIPLPSLPEQKTIASILGTLDDKIELNRKMNETLEAMARAIFKSWFVDFDPIPGHGPHKEWKDSQVGKIPKGWRVEKVSGAFEINPFRQINKGMQYSHVDMASLPTASARVTNVTRREFTGSGSKFKNGDVLFARITPCLENGKTALVDFLPDNEYGWGSTEFIVFGPKEPLNPWFVYCVARNQEFRDHAIRAMSGTSGRQRVEIGCFSNFSIVIPPAEIAAKFAGIVKPWFTQMKTNDEQSDTLIGIRDALLPKLLSGEIRVKS